MKEEGDDKKKKPDDMEERINRRYSDKKHEAKFKKMAVSNPCGDPFMPIKFDLKIPFFMM